MFPYTLGSTFGSTLHSLSSTFPLSMLSGVVTRSPCTVLEAVFEASAEASDSLSGSEFSVCKKAHSI